MSTKYVYVRGLTDDGSLWTELTAALRARGGFADDEFDIWPRARHDAPGLRTRRGLASYGVELSARLDEWERAAARGDTQIVLVGNSIGSLIVRWAWLYGAGKTAESSVVRPWTSRVRRIVLVAGVNRGLDARRATGRSRAILWAAALTRPFGTRTYHDALAGSNFLSELRLRWILLRADEAEAATVPQVVQLLGTRDSLVSRSDSIDLEQLPTAASVEVAGAKHTDVLSLSTADDRGERLELLARVLAGPVDPTIPPDVDAAGVTRHVVLVMHGIRVRSLSWVKELRQTIDALGPEWRAVGPSYGFFSALDFALPISRHRRVRWFLDQYTQEVARHPAARFQFVGHSNGTYLLGRSLQHVPAVVFDRVYLAGSVLPTDYPWGPWLDAASIRQIRSDRGSRDLPVGWLARGLRVYRMRDLGDGGFEGFGASANARFREPKAYKGGHSAPLTAKGGLETIVNYVAGKPWEELGKRSPSRFVHVVGFVAWAMVLAIAVIVVGAPIAATIALVRDPSALHVGCLVLSFVPLALLKYL